MVMLESVTTTISHTLGEMANKIKQQGNKEQSVFDFYLYKKFSSKIPAFLLAILIVFIISSSTTILSGSIVYVRQKGSDFSPFGSSNVASSSIESNFRDHVEIEPDLETDMYKKHEEEEVASARLDVERQLSILRSYTAKSKPLSCEGRGIYVYELPAKFNKDVLAKCNETVPVKDHCKYLSNEGMGEALHELGKGWYNTHQYSLEPIFHTRILNHPCRVKNVEEGKLFYVPFYAGLDVLRWHFKNVSDDLKDSLSNELVEWLELQNSWKRNFGLDHVLVLGKITWDFRRTRNGAWGSRLLQLDELKKPFKLLIERHAWDINEVGVPHPTHFHPSSDQDILALQAQLRDAHRVNLISFAGGSRKASESIRSRLIDQCTSTPDKCTFLNCQNQACLSPVPVIKLFMESEFCLQPPGDSPTRKSLFDSLVAGCIPVVFDPFTAYYQYAWHLPEDYQKYSVYIDQEDVRSSKVNVVESLAKIPLKQRQQMRKYIIHELMPRLVYSDPRAKLEVFEDAFTITVNNLLERLRNSEIKGDQTVEVH